ncbi:FAD-linked oxidase C-terminal domain-containing protein [Naasia aerilata]|uniref:FAD-linked oxidase C-terminal domain-containing protein n=1 Tax=Naasia aerilata TaxID=1162966 RepID=UPI0025748119|nr:FAD-linked oxidase C-terminal domain-containing protein [Naasia aerilata]
MDLRRDHGRHRGGGRRGCPRARPRLQRTRLTRPPERARRPVALAHPGGRCRLGRSHRGGEPAWPGWEDAAVPPAALPAYLRAFEELKARHGVRGLSYGHLGDGCMHTRLDLPSPTTRIGRCDSWRTPPTWWCCTEDRCPASTATAEPGAGCSSGCTRRTP